MLFKQLMLFFGAALWPTVKIQHRVTLQLPIAENEGLMFAIKKEINPAVSFQYVIETKTPKHIIRTVKFSKFTLIDAQGDCDADTRKRIVTVTVTASGIFVKIKTIKRGNTKYEDYFRVYGHTYLRLVDEWDYMKFTQPDKYRKRIGVLKYPHPMVIFAPVFQSKMPENVLYACSYDWYWRVLSGRLSTKSAEPIYPNLGIVRVKSLDVYSVKAPKPGLYRIMMGVHDNILVDNKKNHLQSFMVKEYLDKPTVKLNCARVADAVKALLKIPRNASSVRSELTAWTT